MERQKGKKEEEVGKEREMRTERKFPFEIFSNSKFRCTERAVDVDKVQIMLGIQGAFNI